MSEKECVKVRNEAEALTYPVGTWVELDGKIRRVDQFSDGEKWLTSAWADSALGL